MSLKYITSKIIQYGWGRVNGVAPSHGAHNFISLGTLKGHKLYYIIYIKKCIERNLISGMRMKTLIFLKIEVIVNMSWGLLFNAKWAIFQPYNGEMRWCWLPSSYYTKSNQIKSKVLFKVGTFTNSTNISSHELFKPTCILRYKLQQNKTMSCIKTTYQAKIRCSCKVESRLAYGFPPR